MAVTRLFDKTATASIAHYGDNTGNKAEFTKGYSTKPGHVVQGLLAEHYPNIRFVSSTYVPGNDIPADEPSRGHMVDDTKLRKFCEERGIPLAAIRDLAVRNPGPT